jgi:hypothetical protein
MANKKYSFLLGLVSLVLMTVSAQAQEAGEYEWRDSSLIPASRMPQLNEFLNNQYIYPPKPRNMWEFGAKAVAPTIMGDVPANFPTFGFGVHVRKSLGYLVSLRLEYINGTASGLNWQAANNYMKNSAWKDNGYNGDVVTSSGNRIPGQDQVYYNYKTKVNDISMQMLFSLNNIRFHKKQNKFGLYLIAGIGGVSYDTKVDALNGTAKYNFNSIASGTYDNRKDTRKAVKDLLDGSYETKADNDDKVLGSFQLSGTAGLGISWKFSKRINLAIEDRVTFVSSDLLDGQRWQEHPLGDASMTRNNDVLNYLSIGLNFNLF